MEITVTKKDTPCANCINYMECHTTSQIIAFEMKHGVKILIDKCEKFEERQVANDTRD